MLYVMLVGAYPFERPEDKHDSQKLQKMIQVRALNPHRKKKGMDGCGVVQMACALGAPPLAPVADVGRTRRGWSDDPSRPVA